MFFAFETMTPVTNFLYANLSSNAVDLEDKPKILITQYICQLSEICCVSYSPADSLAMHSSHFLLFEWLSDVEVLPNGYAVTEGYVCVVFQSKATKNEFSRLIDQIR